MIKMLNGNLIVKEIPKEKITSLGLILTASSIPYKKVKVVEPDKDNTLKKDEELYISQSCGVGYNYNDEKCLVINLRDVVLVF